MSSGVNIIGFKEFQAKINNVPKYIERSANAYVKDAALNWARSAKRSAPKDQGTIGNSITNSFLGNMEAEVVVGANYARFVEWGTRSKKKVPAEFSAYESTLSYSKTGDYYDFLNSILDWVKRKGIGSTYSTGIVKSKGSYRITEASLLTSGRRRGPKKEDLLKIATAIAFSILKKGINQQPFFFIHKEPIRKELYTKLETLLNKQI